MSEHLFVYGTLRRSHGGPMHQLLARHARHIADAFVYARLYDIGSYPGLIESTSVDDTVQGELYQLHDHTDVLAQLDEYEQCTEKHPQPWEYLRKSITVYSDEHAPLSAWVYVYNWPVSGLPRVW